MVWTCAEERGREQDMQRAGMMEVDEELKADVHDQGYLKWGHCVYKWSLWAKAQAALSTQFFALGSQWCHREGTSLRSSSRAQTPRGKWPKGGGAKRARFRHSADWEAATKVQYKKDYFKLCKATLLNTWSWKLPARIQKAEKRLTWVKAFCHAAHKIFIYKRHRLESAWELKCSHWVKE